MHRTDKYSQYSSIICPVELNGSVFAYDLNGCEFEFLCCHNMFGVSKRSNNNSVKIQIHTVKRSRDNVKWILMS